MFSPRAFSIHRICQWLIITEPFEGKCFVKMEFSVYFSMARPIYLLGTSCLDRGFLFEATARMKLGLGNIKLHVSSCFPSLLSHSCLECGFYHKALKLRLLHNKENSASLTIWNALSKMHFHTYRQIHIQCKLCVPTI